MTSRDGEPITPSLTRHSDRRRLGYLFVPFEVVSSEEQRVLFPEDISLDHQRVEFREDDTPANRAAVLHILREGARLLGQARPEMIAFACTSGGVFAGAEWHEHLLAQLRRELGGIAFTTAADAVALVAHENGLTRLAMGNPFENASVRGLIDVLRFRGIDVVDRKVLFPDGPTGDPFDLMRTSPERMRAFASEVDHADADAVFLSCTGLQSAAVLDQIEADIGKPVVTSNTAMAYFAATRLEGLAPNPGFGQILDALCDT